MACAMCLFPLICLGFCTCGIWISAFAHLFRMDHSLWDSAMLMLPEMFSDPGLAGAQLRFEDAEAVQGVEKWSLAKLAVEQRRESTAMLEDLAVCRWR